MILFEQNSVQLTRVTRYSQVKTLKNSLNMDRNEQMNERVHLCLSDNHIF